MTRLHIISHTHWDREWYFPFQQFRLNLVNLVDGLLELLHDDPDYLHFMLDGQTVVLEDYLEVRPGREAELREHIQSGRILVGPWYILPDEFLVSPEAIIRNLLQGGRIARRFGPTMQVGYLPDTFGHIAQMPQILRGFGLETATIWRGVDPASPNEFMWEAPDSSRVLTAFIRFGYANAAFLYWSKPDLAARQSAALAEILSHHTDGDDLLFMHGNDHMTPPVDTASNLSAINNRLEGKQLIHSTLPGYFEQVHARLKGNDKMLPVIRGEHRCSRSAHLLPGVLSARMWIKQRNHACENLLERWAEPFSTLASLHRLDGPPLLKTLQKPSDAIRQAWKILLLCHPHDSICGCSVDQVHEEMKPRFDQVDQIGEGITRQSLRMIASCVDTRTSAPLSALGSVIVFNPGTKKRSDQVELQLELYEGPPINLGLQTEIGVTIPIEVTNYQPGQRTIWQLDKPGLLLNLGRMQAAGFDQLYVRGARVERNGDHADIFLKVSPRPDPDLDVIAAVSQEAQKLLLDADLTNFNIHIDSPGIADCKFIAPDVPGLGYRTFWLTAGKPVPHPDVLLDPAPTSIENEFFCILPENNGTISLLDKRTGVIYPGLNRFVDGGDGGDEYNYQVPQDDLLYHPDHVTWRIDTGPSGSSLTANLSCLIPKGLAPDRKSRSNESVPLVIETRVTVKPGVPRLDIHTRVNNPAGDHRLRVHFPYPTPVNTAWYDSHFALLERAIGVPAFDPSWIEDPRPEQPQRVFTSLIHENLGLTIAGRGLPEVEAIAKDPETTEIAVTLLRCVGWLSRGDLTSRKGHAGPGFPTPGAQMIGDWEFDYSVIPHTDGWLNAHAEAVAFDLPLRADQTNIHTGSMPPEASLLQIEPASFVITALKTADDGGQDWLVRGYNPTQSPVQVSIQPALVVKGASFARLDETPLEPLKVNREGRVTVQVGSHQIVTIRFHP